jgi:hypothetical protein
MLPFKRQGAKAHKDHYFPVLMVDRKFASACFAFHRFQRAAGNFPLLIIHQLTAKRKLRTSSEAKHYCELPKAAKQSPTHIKEIASDVSCPRNDIPSAFAFLARSFTAWLEFSSISGMI